MVRAAITGAVDYTRANPYSTQWRIKHAIILREMAHQLNARLLESVHAHWCSFVSHPRLEPDSWKNAKKHALEAVTALQHNLFPWQKDSPGPKEDTIISGEYGELIASYKQMVADKARARAKDKDK